jgi:hypothetical protein
VYMISKDKKPIQPGSTLIIKWENLKLDYSDKVDLLLDWKIYPFKLVDKNTIEITLPYKNFINGSIQVSRNGFKSNVLKFSAVI